MTVDDVTYPDHAVAVVNASVDGVYTVSVAGDSVDIVQLPVGDYTAKLTAEIPNYNPVEKSDGFKVLNGTITANVTVDDVTYPDHAVAVVNASVDGVYTVSVAGDNR